MRPSDALEMHREAARQIVLTHNVQNPRVFGSTARGDDVEGSDLDILVDRLPGTTLLDIGGIIHELTELLGVRVDVLTPGCLPERIRAAVLAEARPL
jgi:predicted nucleotidyltransferase